MRKDPCCSAGGYGPPDRGTTKNLVSCRRVVNAANARINCAAAANNDAVITQLPS